MSYALAEADRRIANAISVGVVTAVDAGRLRARVRIGGIETPFIPVMQPRMGGVRLQAMPSPGEQVSVAAPDGDYARAFVLGSIAAGHGVGPEAGHVYLDLGGGDLIVTGRIVLTGDLVVDGTMTITGTVTSEADVVASGVSLTGHTHPHGDPAGRTGAPS